MPDQDTNQNPFEPKLPRGLAEQNRRVLEQLAELQAENPGMTVPDGPQDRTELLPENGDDAGTQPPPPEHEHDSQTAEPETPYAADTDWKQKFLVVDGKYRAEVPRLHQQVQQLTAMVEALQATLKAPAPAAQDLPQTVPDGELTTEQLKAWVADDDAWNEWGEQWWRKQYERQQRDLQPIKRQLEAERQERERLSQETRKTAQQARQQTLQDKLDQILPDWRTQDADQRFKTWMETTREPASGFLYIELLSRAIHDADADRVALLFSSWPGATSAPARPGTRPAPQVPVARQVTVRPTAAGGPARPKPKARTLEELARETTNIVKGRLSQKQIDALDAELATTLGQLRPRE